MDRQLTLKINLGDLIYALTEEGRRHIRDDKMVDEVVADLLAGIITAQGNINLSAMSAEPGRRAF